MSKIDCLFFTRIDPWIALKHVNTITICNPGPKGLPIALVPSFLPFFICFVAAALCLN